MKNRWIPGLGIGLLLVTVLIIAIWWTIFSNKGYDMICSSYGWDMPLVPGINIIMPVMWLALPYLLFLEMLGAVWLITVFNKQNEKMISHSQNNRDS